MWLPAQGGEGCANGKVYRLEKQADSSVWPTVLLESLAKTTRKLLFKVGRTHPGRFTLGFRGWETVETFYFVLFCGHGGPSKGSGAQVGSSRSAGYSQFRKRTIGLTLKSG